MDMSEAPSESELSVVAPLPAITLVGLHLHESKIAIAEKYDFKIFDRPYNNLIRKKPRGSK